jgi:excisionase family DNA binding protein
MTEISDLVKLPDDNAILTAGEAATFLAVSLPTLRRLGDEGRISFITLTKTKRGHRRYSMASILGFIEASLTTSTPTKATN